MKSKQKELERQLLGASGNDADKIENRLTQIKRDVFTDGRKVGMRRKDFEKA